jgi:hypothetical protein
MFHYSVGGLDAANDGARVELKGSPRTLAFPPICPNCGGAASEQVRIEKVFRRSSGRRRTGGVFGSTSSGYVIVGATVPFCASCAARHRQLREPLPWWTGWLSIFRSPLILAAGISGALAFSQLRQPPLEGWLHAGSELAVLGFLVFIPILTTVQAWWANRFYRIAAQTEVTSAFDFTDTLGMVRERHAYAIRNAAAAAAFIAANRDRTVTDAERDHDSTLGVAVVVGAVALLALGAWLINVLIPD